MHFLFINRAFAKKRNNLPIFSKVNEIGETITIVTEIISIIVMRTTRLSSLGDDTRCAEPITVSIKLWTIHMRADDEIGEVDHTITKKATLMTYHLIANMMIASNITTIT